MLSYFLSKNVKNCPCALIGICAVIKATTLFVTEGVCTSIVSILRTFFLPYYLTFYPFNKNVQWEITGHTTHYYQNTTKCFEFTYANFKIKAQSKIAKGDK